ncbi:MAG: hypothetical protein IT334_00110 [Thermomicrobiales bacterium]|nr:hypothetical protein [Thermomicrobiales bacterium]
MIDDIRQFKRKVGTPRGLWSLAGQALAIALVSALLLIPSTCAQVMGPHSIFTDTTGGHAHHHGGAHEADGGYRTVADLERHVISGNGSPGWAVAEDDPDDDCPTKPTLRDLPSTMTMGAINAPATLDNDFRLELPAADQPAETGMASLHGAFQQIEPPPPR